MPNVVLTFNDLSAGDIVNSQFAADGVTISSGHPGNPVMVFDTENPTGGDYDLATGSLGNVLILSEDGDSNDPDDNAGGGAFIFEFDAPSEVLNFNVLDTEEGGFVKLFGENGSLIAKLPLTVTGNGQIGTVNVGYDNVARMEVTLKGSGAIDNLNFRAPAPQGDGVVEGSNEAELIDVAYVGDPDGDRINNNDAILPGEAPQDDIVDAFGGDDWIKSGTGDDEIFAGSGDDHVRGGAGNDIIYGDSNYSGPGAGVTARESLNWSDAAADNGGTLDNSGFVQDTGSVEVTFSVLHEHNASTSSETDTQIVSGIDSGAEPINDNSSLFSLTDGGGSGAAYQLAFSDAVENVSFRVNDVDGDGLVRVRAFDENGNEIEISLTGGGNVTLSDTGGANGNDLIDSNGGYAPDDDGSYSALVLINGPVARITIEHAQNGSATSGINVTDVFFDVAVVDDGEDGDDILRGGAGDDIIFGEGGDDIIIGGSGADTQSGGTGDDTLEGGSGNDTLIGGDGNDTADGGDGDDIIDTSGSDPFDDRDIVSGGAGDDTITTGDDQDTIFGGSGDDTVDAGRDDDTVFGDGGDDQIEGGEGDDTISGGTGADTITGGQGMDNLFGGDDRDTFIVDSGEDGIGDIIDGGEGGDDFDTLDLTGSGPFNITYTSADLEDGFVDFLNGDGTIKGTLQFTEIENVVPCFTPGTAIATPRGEVLVEELQVGDRVITRDNGIQNIRWIGAKQLDGRALMAEPHLQPVLVQRGSLGNDLPERDMYVSPNHRMLVNNDRVSLYFEENEVLVSAKHLVNPTEGVQIVKAIGVTYIHFMFDAHEVVLANGAWTESFQPGDYSLKGIGNAQRNEIFELFPELSGKQGLDAYTSARLTLKKHEARMLFK